SSRSLHWLRHRCSAPSRRVRATAAVRTVAPGRHAATDKAAATARTPVAMPVRRRVAAHVAARHATPVDRGSAAESRRLTLDRSWLDDPATSGHSPLSTDPLRPEPSMVRSPLAVPGTTSHDGSRVRPYTPILATLGYVMSPDGNRVLMIHRNARADDQHLGKYNGLGGKLEADEYVLAR